MRCSGILLHITSLPSPGGIGDLGPEAYAFADFLRQSGMKIWQVLPVGPTGFGESPYQSPSAFAGNPLLISPELLRRENLLTFDDAELYHPSREDTVNFEQVRINRSMLLRRSFKQSADKIKADTERFRRENSWVEDYALFAALKDHFNGEMWSRWPDRDAKFRKQHALDHYRALLDEDIRFHIFCQYLFRKQWFALKNYCNERSISLFGDMPIYVAEDSADTWTHPEVFQLDKELIPKRVAGVPPDYFSADGQLWGNPLYRWHYLRFRKYGWWVERMRGMASMYDLVRIDHFIGFANYYSVVHGAPNARQGKWIVGPGKKLFKRLRSEVPGMNIVAEDLGEVGPRVKKLLNWCGYPGMKVLGFGFDGDPAGNPHHPSHYGTNSVVYTGTHDNDTILGWYTSAGEDARGAARETLGFNEPEDAPAAFVKAAFESPCERAVLSMQDLLGLDGSARMNLPGTVGNNWLWRMKTGDLTPELSEQLKALNERTNR